MRFLEASNPVRLRGSAKVLGLYVLISVAWIAFTDELLQFFNPPHGHTLKGVSYVLLSGSILFWLCRRLVDDAQRVENTLAEIFRQTELGVFLKDGNGAILDCNAAFAELLGYDSNELIGKRAHELIDENERANAIDKWNDILIQRKKRAYSTARRYLRKNGEPIWLRVVGSRIDYAKQRESFLVCLAQNITNEVQALESLQAQQAKLKEVLKQTQLSEARFRRLVESIPTGVAVCLTNGRVLDCNPVLLDLLGYTQEELESGGLNWLAVTPREFREADENAMDQLQRELRCGPYEKEVIAKDGTQIPVMVFGSVCGERDGSLELVSSVMDMREPKQTQAELLRLGAAVGSATESVVITDTSGKLEYINPAFERIAEISAAEAIGKKLPEVLQILDVEGVSEEITRQLGSGRNWNGHIRTRSKDGSERLSDTTISIVRDKAGNVVNHIAVGRDITRERRLELQLMQTQKLEAVGQLTGGVAHDLNNVLQVVHSSAELALRRPDESFREKKLLDVLAASTRGAAMISQLLSFARKQPLQSKPLNLNEVIDDTAKMLRRLVPENIELLREQEPALKQINADPVRLSQLLMNLVVNARDAMPDGGCLTIRTSMHSERGTSECVRLSVVDTGVGMDELTRARMFEPFFTTKDPGKGTGLGLATVHEVATQCGAKVHVISEVGNGTEFAIDFPPITSVDDSAPAMNDDDGQTAFSGTALVCEDDPQIRLNLCEFLSGTGLEVRACSNPKEAREIAERQRPMYLVTDLVMPGGNGLELAEGLAAKYPGLRILLITGHTEHVLLEKLHSQRRLGYLQKPFTTALLMERLRGLTNESNEATEV